MYDLSHHSQMGKIFAIHHHPGAQSLIHTYRTSGGGESSSQAFRTNRMLVQEMPCFVFEERHRLLSEQYAWHVYHWISDLAPSKTDFQASPRGGAEADFEALNVLLSVAIIRLIVELKGP